MKRLLSLLLIVTLAIGLSLAGTINPGAVSIFYPPYRIDLSLNLAVLLVIGGAVLFYALLRGVGHAVRLPERVKTFKAHRRREGAHRALREAILALAEGRYLKVERLAIEAAVEPADGEPAALLAALAAQRLQEYQRRDGWLEPLLDKEGPLAHAALLTQAETIAQQRDFARGLQIIAPLLKNNRRNIRALHIALKIYRGAERWEDALRTLRLLSNRGALHPAAVESLTVHIYRELAEQRADDAYALTVLWRNVLPREAIIPAVAQAMALAFHRAGIDWQARTIIEQALLTQWNTGLVRVYSEVAASQPTAGITRAEWWLSIHGDDPALLQTLGRLCMAQELWGKAMQYFQTAFTLQPDAETAARLALLHAKGGDVSKKQFYLDQAVHWLLYNSRHPHSTESAS
ncbi:MAG: heme biosynthesis HemY N-terminal domain-containing protein [Burkholderiaceae bacterium]|jgi:HemY protein